MTAILKAFVLGIIQGVTEFLPISSSGHLVIFGNLFGLAQKDITFEVCVHFGTLLSIIAVYYADLRLIIREILANYRPRSWHQAFHQNDHFRLGILIVIGTLPAVIAGLFAKDWIESIFHNLRLVGVTLMITGFILFTTRFIRPGSPSLNSRHALLIGFAQMFAILPGISRSGSTIGVGLLCKLGHEQAARFSFLLAVPAILGATILQIGDISGSSATVAELLAGFISSFIIGYLTIRLLLGILRRGRLYWFAPYCLIIGLLTLVLIQ